MAVFCLASAAGGQETAAPATQTDYAKEAFVVESTATTVQFNADGTGQTEATTAVKIQSEAGVQAFGLLRFNHADANESVEIVYVRVRKADGTVITTPPQNVQDMPAEITRSAPFYSDLRETHVAVRGLAAGDTLEFQVRTNMIKPQVPGEFWYAYNFFKTGIVKSESLQITVPKDKYVNVKSHEVQPTVREEDGRRIYTWKTANLEQKPKKNSGLTTKVEAPPPAVELSTFRSWEEIGRWYGGLQKERVAVTPDVQAKALELTKGLSSDSEKIQALYQYVSGHFRYIALSFGIGRYQPHSASDVLANEYGDCKDKHTLLAALLQAVGIRAWPALINSTRKIEIDLPSPAQFDHAITAVPRGNDILWLDSTPGVAPIGFLLAGLRDKEALVIFDDKPAALVRTPAVPPFSSDITFTAETKLGSDGVLTGHMERTVRGDFEVLLRAGFRSTPRAQWQELMQKLSYANGFAGTVSHVDAGPLEDPQKPLRISYDYKRTDFGDWENRRIVAPLPPLLPAIRADEEKPQDPILLGAPGEVSEKARLQLPPGYTVTPPASIDLNEDFAEYHSRSRVENGALLTERRLIVKKQEVNPAQWEVYKKFTRTVVDDYGRFMDLTSTAGEPAGKAAEVAGSDAEARQLLAKARDAVNARNFRAAQEALEQLVKLDPKRRGVWLGLGMLAAAQKRHDEAIQDYRKELQNHPDNLPVYSALGQMLESEKRHAEAAAVYEEGLKQDPKNAQMEALLGIACRQAGEKEKALAALNKAAELDPGANTANTVGYELAELELDLPRAKEYAIRAVTAVESETQKITLATLKREDLARMNTLSAYWDTLGWVYFKTGELELAERYLQAAWKLSQNAVEGDHLAQVYEKQKKWKPAAHQYELALGASRGPERDEILQRLSRAREKAGPAEEVQRIADAARKAGPGKTLTFPVGPGEELSRMRTTRIGPAKNRSGSAEFLVLMSNGAKVEEVRYLHGDVELKPMEDALRATRFDQPFPDPAPTKIVRRGILMCAPKGNCDFTVLTPDVVTSVE